MTPNHKNRIRIASDFDRVYYLEIKTGNQKAFLSSDFNEIVTKFETNFNTIFHDSFILEI